MNLYAYPVPVITGRAVALAVAVAAHALLIWGLASGLARQVVQLVVDDIHVIDVEQPKRFDPPPPPPREPDYVRYQPDVPKPDFPIEWPEEASPISGEPERLVEKREPTEASPRVVRVAPRLDARRSPGTEDFYPSVSRRLEEEGVATVSACVGPDGRALRAAVERSSGHARLDEAAIRWAQRARWSPGTEDGRPVETCGYRFNVVFRLTSD